jgi:hypothetical protein
LIEEIGWSCIDCGEDEVHDRNPYGRAPFITLACATVSCKGWSIGVTVGEWGTRLDVIVDIDGREIVGYLKWDTQSTKG